MNVKRFRPRLEFLHVKLRFFFFFYFFYFFFFFFFYPPFKYFLSYLRESELSFRKKWFAITLYWFIVATFTTWTFYYKNLIVNRDTRSRTNNFMQKYLQDLTDLKDLFKQKFYKNHKLSINQFYLKSFNLQLCYKIL